MVVVGLTGGIGSGKTTVANFFNELGVPVIDTDVIARDVVQPGTDALKKIIIKFGVNILQSDGKLDRTKLRKAVFNNVADREWLESLLHPLIKNETARQITAADESPYCIVVIPLLAENYPNPLINRVLVVDIDEGTQLQRASLRDANTPEQIRKIMKTQVSRQQRLTIADDVIINNSGLNELKNQTRKLHEKYLKSNS